MLAERPGADIETAGRRHATSKTARVSTAAPKHKSGIAEWYAFLGLRRLVRIPKGVRDLRAV